MQNNITSAALSLVSDGFSVLPIGANKAPFNGFKWTGLIDSPLHETQIEYTFSGADGVGIICGAISGNLEVLDVDLKYDTSGSLWDSLASEIEGTFPELWQRLQPGIIITVNEGRHLYYRCDSIEGSKKLASGADGNVLIETRGERSYVAAPPTLGYRYASDHFSIPVITAEERALLFSIAKGYNHVPANQNTSSSHQFDYVSDDTDKPGVQYSAEADVPALLIKNGWKYVCTKGAKMFYKRPGESDTFQSGNWHTGLRLFYCHSSSTNLPNGRGLTGFTVLAYLEFNGDFKAAAKHCVSLGYGRERERKSISITGPQRGKSTFTQALSGSISNPQPEVKPRISEHDRLMQHFDSFRYRPGRVVSKPIPAIEIQGKCISSAGNITTILGQSKAGKSALIAAGIAGSLNSSGSEIDTLGLNLTPANGKLVLHIDSEQSTSNHQGSGDNILKRAGLESRPVNFVSLCFTGFSVKQANAEFNLALQFFGDLFGGVHSIWIDGPGDFVNSVNDETECKALVDSLSAKADTYNCPVICILHYNPGSDVKGRGHLGSMLERKSESVISVTIKGNTSIVEAKLLRNAGGFTPITFQYSTSAEYHVSTGLSENKQDRMKAVVKQRMCALWHFFQEGKVSKTYSEIQKHFMESEGLKDRSAKGRIADLITDGIIESVYTPKPGYQLSVQQVQSGAFAQFCT